MFTHHVALSAVHLAIMAILYHHGALAEAVCVLAAAAIYASMPPSGH
jgi:hypothetical protein